MTEITTDTLKATARDLFQRRDEPARYLTQSSEAIAYACHAMALRFHDGGKVLAFGNGAASTDSLHISVEFVHPVIVGKRALPGYSLTNDAATLTDVTQRSGFAEVYAKQIRDMARPQDIALGVSVEGQSQNVLRGLEEAKNFELLTVALTGPNDRPLAESPAIDHVLIVDADDPFIVKEVQVTVYHILWELVHVFFEQPGTLGPSIVRSW